MRYLLISLFIFAFATFEVFAACTETSPGIWEPDTLSQADVQLCIDDAGFDANNTIQLPSGTSSDWTSDVFSSVPCKIIGAGIDVTIINVRAEGAYHEGSGFTFEISGTEYFELGHMTLDAPTVDTYATNGVINIHEGTTVSGNESFRIHHVRMTDNLDRGILILDGIYGLIDNCTISEPAGESTSGLQGINPRGKAADSWASPETVVFGSGDFVFIEDCTFDWDSPQDAVLDSHDGGRYVFRYNTVKNAGLSHHGKDSGNQHSVVAYEIYENTFAEDVYSGTVARFFYSRGGSGLLYNNTVTGDYGSDPMQVTNYCSCKDENSCSSSSWPECRTYPCDQQVGRTMVDGSQVHFPAYEWGNTEDGADIDWSVFEFCSGEFTIENNIITIGTNPTSDDALNDVEYSYTPYTYPHPLRSGAAGPDDGSNDSNGGAASGCYVSILR